MVSASLQQVNTIESNERITPSPSLDVPEDGEFATRVLRIDIVPKGPSPSLEA